MTPTSRRASNCRAIYRITASYCLAAYLYLLREKHPRHYRNIVETIRLAAPFFGDFILRPNPLNPEKIRLEWRERGSDRTFGPNALSDGTLRFICLTTLFLQPPESLPATIAWMNPNSVCTLTPSFCWPK